MTEDTLEAKTSEQDPSPPASALPEPTGEAAEIRRRLQGVLREHLTLVAPDEDVPMETELGELGLDSMNAINLLLDLEGEFEVSFPDEMLDAETFYSAATLERAVHQLLEG